MVHLLTTWLLVGIACRARDVDEPAAYSGDPPLCREDLTEYEQATAAVNGNCGNVCLLDQYEWNAIDCTVALDGAVGSSFSRVFTYSAGFDPVVVEWIPA
jgi:hypothetical protein